VAIEPLAWLLHVHVSLEFCSELRPKIILVIFTNAIFFVNAFYLLLILSLLDKNGCYEKILLVDIFTE
jgi:hypothetical protein